MRFVVAGGHVTDCFVRTPRLPVWGSEYEVRSVRTSAGGKALNQAVALARLGAHVTAVGVVGDDGCGPDHRGGRQQRRAGADVGDACLDLVETGSTAQANGLVVRQDFGVVTAHLARSQRSPAGCVARVAGVLAESRVKAS